MIKKARYYKEVTDLNLGDAELKGRGSA